MNLDSDGKKLNLEKPKKPGRMFVICRFVGWLSICVIFYLSWQTFGFCTVEGTLSAFQSKLISSILPLGASLGLLIAGLSFIAGSPQARFHLVAAMFGAIVGFGAPSIVEFIRALVK